MPNYPNKNRTKEERKARYCYLRHLGYSRLITRSVVGFRDSKIIVFIKMNQTLRKWELVDYRKDKKDN